MQNGSNESMADRLNHRKNAIDLGMRSCLNASRQGARISIHKLSRNKVRRRQLLADGFCSDPCFQATECVRLQPGRLWKHARMSWRQVSELCV